MQAIRLYDWQDKQKRRPLRELAVRETTDMTRNGTRRLYAWTDGDEQPNLMLYPDKGTAYEDYEERPQKQRIGVVYLYEEV